MAITEKYVTSAGSGTGDGSSAGNARTWANMISDINAGGTAGNRYNVLGAISRGATDTISGSGTITSPVIIRGYSSTIGDGYLGRTSNVGALITTNMPAITYSSTFRLNITGSFIQLESLNISGLVSANQVTLGANCFAKWCKIVNASTNAAAIALALSSSNNSADDCDIALTGASGGQTAVLMTGSAAKAIACHITGGPGVGVQMQSTAQLLDSLIYACTGIGVSVNSTGALTTIEGNTIVGGATDGINIITGTTGLQVIKNNMITDNTGAGLNMVATSNGALLSYNRFRDNSGGNITNSGDWVTGTSYGHVTSGNGTSDYTNSGSGDYSLISTSPAVGAGQPYSRSIGAFQRSSSGGGVPLIGQGLVY